jgi:1,5-anhydro-D-fructose reductase (1,5-anhydro-D-mannitol-forming)
MREKTGWALIGASTIAHEFMINAIRSQPDAEITGIYSASPERGARFAAEHEIPHAYRSLEDALSDPRVDAVYISTTNEKHAPQTIAAARAGKHVLCDKPLATTFADAVAMIAECEAAGVVLATNHHLPNAATHRTIRRLLDEDTVGALRAVRLFNARWLPPDLQTWRTSRPDAGAGVILDVTVHDAALLAFLLGEPVVRVSAVSYRQGLGADGVEDCVLGVMTSERGTPASFHDAWTVPHGGTGLEVHGSEASIIARGVMTSLPVGSVHIRRQDTIVRVSVPDREDLYVRAVRLFQGAMRGEHAVAVSGRDGMAALSVALAALESARTGHSVDVASIANHQSKPKPAPAEAP